jgi:hypothetical protein
VALAVGKGGNRGSGGTSDAGQRFDNICIAREHAAMLVHDLPRSCMQITRARVVTEAAPVLQHAIFMGGGEIRDRGKARHESLVIGNHSGDLRLLQHDLGNPYGIRIVRILPGQVMPAVDFLPIDQSLSEILHVAFLSVTV